jgi:hypothetical protein
MKASIRLVRGTVEPPPRMLSKILDIKQKGRIMILLLYYCAKEIHVQWEQTFEFGIWIFFQTGH